MGAFDTALAGAALIGAGGATYVAATSSGGSGGGTGGSGSNIPRILEEVTKSVRAGAQGTAKSIGSLEDVRVGASDAADAVENATGDGNFNKFIKAFESGVEARTPDTEEIKEKTPNITDVEGGDGGILEVEAPQGPVLEGRGRGDVGKFISGGLADNAAEVIKSPFRVGQKLRLDANQQVENNLGVDIGKTREELQKEAKRKGQADKIASMSTENFNKQAKRILDNNRRQQAKKAKDKAKKAKDNAKKASKKVKEKAKSGGSSSGNNRVDDVVSGVEDAANDLIGDIL